MKLYICSTYYHVFITMLKQLSQRETADLVICDDLPTGQELSQRIRETGLFRNVWFVEQHRLPEVPARGIVDAVLFQHKRRARTLRPLLPFSVGDYSDICIYHDGTALGCYLNDEGAAYHLIEDSLNFYQYVYQSSQACLLYPHNFRYRIRRLLKAGYFPLGFSPYLVDIEVNDKNNLQIPSGAAVEKPRSQLMEHLSPEQISLLFRIFGYHPVENYGELSAIILTQPLFQDGACANEEEQRGIYREIAEFLKDKGYCVSLKPHPRDSVNYEQLPVTIIQGYFPSELFGLGKNTVFDCAVTVNSSALAVFPARKRYFWDQVNKKLLETEENKEYIE